ncbi:MAG TPA: class I SAM-dependent rRNA methyltransferase [Symbiobacteriaceae bacterium]|jgi:23S rRNA (cytosine1962-C5)-methyltransferase|nr:class I SAM-dependent rRNA methyltransferase [Symbiobacteriaceae bacterium]
MAHKAVVHLARGKSERIVEGHPWVFKGEVHHINGDYSPGDIVTVVDGRGLFLGKGYINPASQIIVRMLTQHDEEINREWFRRRLEQAWNYRKKLLADTTACRVVFGEADFLPGLIVDKFGDVLSIQTLALGIDIWLNDIADILMELIQPVGIFERNDVPVRELEGLQQRKGFLRGEFDPRLIIPENGLKVVVDVKDGQKTGYFLDQRDNRRAIRPYVNGGRVLDCFSNVGGFSLNAVAGGAAEVTAVDASASALASVMENAELNGMTDKIRTMEGNAFDILRKLEADKEQYDTIVLDPPAFAKNKSSLEGAVRGYKEINLRALRMIKEGGFLVTCSCSFHMRSDLFKAVVADAALDARRRLRLVEERAQGVDHPIVVGYDESHYLKCLIYQVI